MLSREWRGSDKARTQILSKRSSLELGVKESRKEKEVSRKSRSDVSSITVEACGQQEVSGSKVVERFEEWR